MNDIVINVEGQSFVVDRDSIIGWLNQNGKVFTGQTNSINEITKLDDQGRTIING